MYEWLSFRTLLPLVLGAFGLFVFVIIEIYIPKEPMVPLKIFLSRTAVSGYLGTFLHGMVCILQLYADIDHMEPYHLLRILVSISTYSHPSSCLS